jgi:hypothetical protein
MSTGVVESTVEDAALSWLAELGYAVVNEQEIAPANSSQSGRLTATLSWSSACVKPSRGWSRIQNTLSKKS